MGGMPKPKTNSSGWCTIGGYGERSGYEYSTEKTPKCVCVCGAILFALISLWLSLTLFGATAFAAPSGDPNNPSNPVTVESTKTLTSLPTPSSTWEYIGTAQVVGINCVGDTYVAGYKEGYSNRSRSDGDWAWTTWVAGGADGPHEDWADPTGTIWFDIHIDPNEYFANGITVSNAAMCVDRRDVATPGASDWFSGGATADHWPIQYTGYRPDLRVYIRCDSVNTRTNTATYSIMFQPYLGNYDYKYLSAQRLVNMSFSISYTVQGYIQVNKVSANPSCTNDNPNYSLEGAKYGLWTTEELAQAGDTSNAVYVFTTDANGNTEVSSLLDGGSYFLKETQASKGYELDQTIYEVTATAGTATVTVKEQPILDPFLVTKRDIETGATPQGSATLAGAQFRIDYYPGMYTTVAAAQSSGSPSYSWTIETTTNGEGRLSNRVSGDEIIYMETGDPGIPIGTVLVQEIKAPSGYRLNDPSPIQIAQITEDGVVYISSERMVFTNEVETVKISVQKVLKTSGGNVVSPERLAGVQVQVKSQTTNEIVATITLDSQGKGITGDIPVDTYELFEVEDSLPASVEAWYITNGKTADTPFDTIEATVDGETYNSIFEDRLTTQTVELWKQPSDAQLAAQSSIYTDYTGCTYGLYDTAEHAAARGEEGRIFTFVCESDGHTNKTDELECGQILYAIELTAPESGAFKLSDEVITVELTGEKNVWEIEEEMYSGSIYIEKHDAETHSITPQGDGTFEGIEVTAKYWPVYAASTADLAGDPEATYTWTFGADGTITETGLPVGSYLISETSLGDSVGYLLSDETEHLVVIEKGVTSYLSDGGNAAVFENMPARITVHVAKSLLVPGGGAADTSVLAGVKILVRDKDENLVDTIVLDGSGEGTSSAILTTLCPLTLVEDASSLPASVQTFAWTQYGSRDSSTAVVDTIEATIEDDGKTFEVTFTDYTKDTPGVTKTDIDTGEGLEGATISLYRCPDEYITISDGVVTVSDAFDGTVLSNWEHVADFKSDAQGYAGLSMVEFGYYCWTELSAFVTPSGDTYLNEARTQDIDATEPILHPWTVDKNSRSSAFSCADKRIDISVAIHEVTIKITSAGLDSTTADYTVNNVGTESQWWQISAENLSSVDTENFYIEFDFDGNIRQVGGKVIAIGTPTTTGDKDGVATLYYKTTETDEWTVWAEVSATEAARFEVSSLGDVELTAIKLDFGNVTKDMTVGGPTNSDDLVFEAVYTVALNPEDNVTILHDSRVYTDLAVSESTTIWADDVDSVETTVIFPKTLKSSFNPNGGLRISTGDAGMVIFGGIVLAGVLGLWVLLRRKKSSVRAAAGIVAAMLCMAIVPAIALAEPAVLEKTFTYMSGEATPTIPETVDEEGVTYQLDSTSPAVPDPTFTPESKTFTKTVEGSFATLEEAEEAYPATIEIDEDGYTGEIPQTRFEYKEIIGTYTRVDDVTRTFSGLTTNDVAQEALSGIDWDHSTVVWTPEATNSVGMPTSYTATVTTKEATIIPVQTGYTVTATYEGTLAKPDVRYIITATYIGPEAAPEPEPVPDQVKNGLSAGAIAGIAGGGVAFVGIIAGLVFFIRRKNVIVCDIKTEEEIGKAMFKEKDGHATVTVPASIPVETGVILKLKEEHATNNPLTVVHEGRGSILETKASRLVYVLPSGSAGEF